MHPRQHAHMNKDHAALIMASSGQKISYGELEAAANQGAHFLRQLGLIRGDVMALLMDNEAALFDLAWAAQRSGLYLTTISTKLSASDIAYILQDSGAKILVASDRLAELASQALAQAPAVQGFCVDMPAHRLKSWQAAVRSLPTSPASHESAGTDMLYSSGTTGRPKGVKPLLPTGPVEDHVPLETMGTSLYAMDQHSRYLSTSPLYHAAPLRWAMTIQRLGGTVVVMENFDAEDALSLIQQHRITHATWVPTHFIRLLKLPDAIRLSYDHQSLKAVIHAAAPCPVPVKQAMIQWWGPIIHEYYSGTEQCGITGLSSQEWLQKRGSVGKAILGTIKILDDQGRECAAGQTGDVYFADGPSFSYHQDAEKTASAHNDRGWATLGDIGHVDADGYLFLTDRKSFMIISGGVNIYPQEIENLLATHPSVADAAVVGLPDSEMGERVVAVIQPDPEQTDMDALAAELHQFTRQALGGLKAPRQYIFQTTLPREATGKLMKARLINDLKAQCP